MGQCEAEVRMCSELDSYLGSYMEADVGTYNAVASHLDGIPTGACLGTFDCSLAFDCVRPRLVERLSTHFGMPIGARGAAAHQPHACVSLLDSI